MLHYLAVWKAMVSLHRPVHSKITLTYSLTWQTDRCTPRRMAFKAFPRLCSSFLCAYCSKKLPERAPTKKQLRVLSIIDQLPCVGTATIRLRSIKSSLPFSLPLRHSRDELFQALYHFSVLQATESWAGPGNEAMSIVGGKQRTDHMYLLHLCVNLLAR